MSEDGGQREEGEPYPDRRQMPTGSGRIERLAAVFNVLVNRLEQATMAIERTQRRLERWGKPAVILIKVLAVGYGVLLGATLLLEYLKLRWCT